MMNRGIMKHATRFTLCLALFAWILAGCLEPCTTFVLKDGKGRLFFGRNFDFPAGPGHIHVNLRGAEKTSLPTPGEKPLTWVAKSGSISFNALLGRRQGDLLKIARRRRTIGHWKEGGGVPLINDLHNSAGGQNRRIDSGSETGHLRPSAKRKVQQSIAPRKRPWYGMNVLSCNKGHFRLALGELWRKLR